MQPRTITTAILATAICGAATATETEQKPPEFPDFKTVSEGYEEVVSTADASKPFYRIWKRGKDAQLLAEIPADYESRRFFIVPTVAGGDTELGVYSIWHSRVGQGARYHYWKRYDKQLALMEPNLKYRALGDAEQKLASQRVSTDSVIVSVPIVCMGPGGGPVIDLDQLLVANASKFFGQFATGADIALTRIESAKVFPLNLELTFSFPQAGGQLAVVHYSIGGPPPARGRIIERGVDDNESWQKARELYGHLNGAHFWSIVTASNWIGAAHVNKYRKGDPGAGDPITPVDVDRQRRALKFVIDNAFRDEAYGLDPELLSKLAVDQWYDEGYSLDQDYPVHDQVLGLQSVTLTLLMYPTRLRRIQDNELRVPADEDALTVPEVLNAILEAVWPDRDAARYTNRHAMFSSLERNLQREHLNRLIDLATGMSWPNASGATIAVLARQQLREIADRVEAYERLDMDDYTEAHLADSAERIRLALEAAYIRDD